MALAEPRGFDPRDNRSVTTIDGTDEPAQMPANAGTFEIRTANQNMGAVRVAQPRDMRQVMLRIQQAAQVMGHSWEYAIPFKDRRSGRETLVTGATIKCASAVLRAFGNCTVGFTEIREESGSYLMTAVFTDVEAGVQFQRPLRQRKDQNVGMGGDRGRTEDIAFLIGASKAARNVIVQALGDLIEEARYESKRALTDRIEKDPERALTWIRDKLAHYNIDEQRIVRAYGSPLQKLRPQHLAQISKLMVALDDGAINADEVFPATAKEGSYASMQERDGGNEDIEREADAGQQPEPEQQPRPNRAQQTARQETAAKPAAQRQPAADKSTPKADPAPAASKPAEAKPPQLGDVKPAQYTTTAGEVRKYPHAAAAMIDLLADLEAEIAAGTVQQFAWTNREFMAKVMACQLSASWQKKLRGFYEAGDIADPANPPNPGDEGPEVATDGDEPTGEPEQTGDDEEMPGDMFHKRG